jgi:hypothetical protein
MSGRATPSCQRQSGRGGCVPWNAGRVTDTDEAAPGEIEWSLQWTDTDSGGLSGVLTARNVSARVVRISGKPGLTPLGRDGESLDAPTIVTLEMRVPGYAEVQPGRTASTRVGWAGWDGVDPCGEVRIRWRGGEVVVSAEGPVRPRSEGPPTNLWSSWFTTD